MSLVTKLNQILAVEKGVKSDVQRKVTDAYHTIQKAPLLSGIARTYQPIDDEGEQLPPESTKVQVQAEGVLKDVGATLTRLFDVTATKDWANCTAKASVKVDGNVLLADVPVTYLLFLEKQLTDIHTLISKLPTLDPSETWAKDENTDTWRTEPVKTTRTKKVPRNHVLAEATDKNGETRDRSPRGERLAEMERPPGPYPWNRGSESRHIAVPAVLAGRESTQQEPPNGQADQRPGQGAGHGHEDQPAQPVPLPAWLDHA